MRDSGDSWNGDDRENHSLGSIEDISYCYDSGGSMDGDCRLSSTSVNSTTTTNRTTGSHPTDKLHKLLNDLSRIIKSQKEKIACMSFMLKKKDIEIKQKDIQISKRDAEIKYLRGRSGSSSKTIVSMNEKTMAFKMKKKEEINDLHKEINALKSKLKNLEAECETLKSERKDAQQSQNPSTIGEKKTKMGSTNKAIRILNRKSSDLRLFSLLFSRGSHKSWDSDDNHNDNHVPSLRLISDDDDDDDDHNEDEDERYLDFDFFQ